MNVAIYARVSTSDKGQSIDTQTRELIIYCKARGWDYSLYSDDVSATKARVGLDRMMEACRKRLFDAVIVWKIDRFARSMKDFVFLTQMLDSAGVRFIAITQNIDTDQANPGSRLLMNMLAAMAEFEHSLISERVKAGVARRKEKGLPVGRQKKIFNMDEARRLHDEEGISWRGVAKTMGVKKSTLLERMKKHDKTTNRTYNS